MAARVEVKARLMAMVPLTPLALMVMLLCPAVNTCTVLKADKELGTYASPYRVALVEYQKLSAYAVP